MIRLLSTNITSPLGMTTEQNYQAVRSGSSALACHRGMWNLQEPFAASLFSEEQMAGLLVSDLTRFESLVLCSVRDALSQIDINISSSRVLFILSTTKGNIELLDGLQNEENEYPGIAAKRIADILHITTEPVVVCNACISGLAALILAQRMLDAGLYDYAIVAGAEVQSKFIVSGFQSFKAVTEEICRPFDIERLGLNLGEGAGCMIFAKRCEDSVTNGAKEKRWYVADGCVRNDAYHLSSPHPQGEGYLLALNEILRDAESLATLSVHGTATMYNDQMESKAIERAGLSDVPLTSLKGVFGHTMGAAGIIETIITMRAIDDGIVIGARGFEEIGVSGKINISEKERRTYKTSFIKMLSGFGGCNAGAYFTKEENVKDESFDLPQLAVSHEIIITPDKVIVDGEELETTAKGKALLTEIYKNKIGGYAKFYKMDMLTRLTFVASELLIKTTETNDMTSILPDTQTAVILFNRSSSIVADKLYYETIRNDDKFYPSPASFLYTLPNLTTGEMAIKHHLYGETSFYILPEKDEKMMDSIIRTSFMDKKTKTIIGGWVDCSSEEVFEANIRIYNSSFFLRKRLRDNASS